MARYFTVGLLLAEVFVMRPAAQSPAPAVSEAVRFEVASVKPSRPNAMGGGFDATPGRFSVENRPLSEVIFFAHDTDRFRTVGPDWIDRERFDITATGAVAGQTKLMLRQLLQARFGLRAHVETRTQPVYVLTVVRAGDQLGDVDPPSRDRGHHGSPCSGPDRLDRSVRHQAGMD